MKLDKDFYIEKAIYPHNEEFGDDAKFKIEHMGKALLENKAEITIKANENSPKKDAINNSIENFNIEKVYKSHNKYIDELVNKVKIYNESQIESYLSEFNEMFSSREEILAFVFGENLRKEDFGKRPLSKLTHDILEELGVML